MVIQYTLPGAIEIEGDDDHISGYFEMRVVGVFRNKK